MSISWKNLGINVISVTGENGPSEIYLPYASILLQTQNKGSKDQVFHIFPSDLGYAIPEAGGHPVEDNRDSCLCHVFLASLCASDREKGLVHRTGHSDHRSSLVGY